MALMRWRASWRICFSRRPAAEWHANHPVHYVGLVWVRVLPQEANIGREHQLTINIDEGWTRTVGGSFPGHL